MVRGFPYYFSGLDLNPTRRHVHLRTMEGVSIRQPLVRTIENEGFLDSLPMRAGFGGIGLDLIN